jgi:uncharacterized OsmC-like protein
MIPKILARTTLGLLCVFTLGIAGCGGKEAVSAVDIEKQAFEDLRAEIREAIERDNQRRVSETHRALLAATTAEERSAIARTHTKAMNAAISTIQSI